MNGELIILLGLLAIVLVAVLLTVSLIWATSMRKQPWARHAGTVLLVASIVSLLASAGFIWMLLDLLPGNQEPELQAAFLVMILIAALPFLVTSILWLMTQCFPPTNRNEPNT